MYKVFIENRAIIFTDIIPKKKNSFSVLYDKQIFHLQKYGGISRYFSEIIHGISKYEQVDVLPKNYFSNNEHLKKSQKNSLTPIYNYKNFKGKNRLIEYLNKRDKKHLNNLIKAGKYDIFHPTYNQTDFLNFIPNDKPFVLTVHDMIHELWPDPDFTDYFNDKINKSILIPKATRIIAVSENTKNDILKFYPSIAPNKISVIHHGYSFSSCKKLEKRVVKEKYLLYVGGRAFYKNFKWLISNVSTFLLTQNIQLVCAGGGCFSIEELQLIKTNNLDNNVSYTNINNDEHLSNLYNHALCFVFPSLYEGFGIPILEAFSNNCPVILSNSSCFPEIAGDAALYFDDQESLLNHLFAISSSSELRNDLIFSGNKVLENYTWEKSIKKHLELYNISLKV
jgi:glycosyltransferase involved in cell wall biosynthesis